MKKDETMCPRRIVAFIHTYMPNGSLDPFMLGLLGGFTKQGVQVLLIKTNSLVWNLGDSALARQYDEWKILEYIESVNPDFVLSTNRGGIPQCLIDNSPCPIVTWLVDVSPFMHHAGKREGLYGVHDYVLTSSSANVKIIERDYPVLKDRVFYQPFATYCGDFDKIGVIEKDVPISFVGTLFFASQIKHAMVALEEDPESYRLFLDVIRVFATKYDTDPEAEILRLGATDVLKKTGLSPLDVKLCAANIESANRRYKLLEALADIGLKLYGTRNWTDVISVSLPLFCAYDPTPIDTREKLASLYQRSKISVNVSHMQAMGGLPYRIFDIMASSSMLLAGEESRPDLELLFGPEMPIPLYRDPAHARELALYYLQNEEARQEIVRKSNDLIRCNFGFDDRVRRMYSILGISLPQASPESHSCDLVNVNVARFRADWTKPLYFIIDHVPFCIKTSIRNFLRTPLLRIAVLTIKDRFLVAREPKQRRSIGSVTAVVVTFNSDEGFSERLGSYIDQVSAVVIVDNSTDPEAKARIEAAASAYPSVRLIQNGDNKGLAAAQNIGLRKVLEQNEAEWILLLDDDSVVPPKMVSALLLSFLRYPKTRRIGLIAPRILDQNSHTENKIIAREGFFRIRRRLCTKKDRYCDTALTAISSGSLIRSEALLDCGFFKENYFIDGVDIEFSLRLRSKGWTILIPYAASLQHKLGKKTRHQVCGKTFITTNHPAWRRYTMYRNRVDIWKKYITAFPTYVIYDILVSVFEAAKVSAFEEDGAKKIGCMWRGIKDGYLGRFPAP